MEQSGTVGGNGGAPFDDGIVTGGIKWIRGGYGAYIDYLQIQYRGIQDPVEHGAEEGVPIGLNFAFLELAENEVITAIDLTYGAYINTLGIHTGDGRYQQWGENYGPNKITFQADLGQQIYSFYGRAGWYIDRLGVYCG